MRRLYSLLLVVFPTAMAFRQVFWPDLSVSISIPGLQVGLDNGDFSSVDLVNTYFARIEEFNLKSSSLRTTFELNANALTEAALLDEERSKSRKRSPLHGIPILLSDGIAFEMNRTLGSSSILGQTDVHYEDPVVVRRLRKAGAIILGKPNFFRTAPSKESLAGRQCTSVYFPNGDACGSSSASAVATSIGLATVSLDTETDGSITCLSANSNVVGIKPTVGLTSQAGAVPVLEQNTIGPIARSVLDAATVLAIITGKDPNDALAPTAPPKFVTNDATGLRKRRDPLEGKRIGVPRAVFLDDSLSGNDPFVNVLFEQALDILKGLGATIVDPADLPTAAQDILDIHSKAQINDLDIRDSYSSQSRLISAEGATESKDTFSHNPSYDYELGATRGIDAALKEHNLDALVLPMTTSKLATIPPAISGYPIVTVPMGSYPANITNDSTKPTACYPAPGMPIGLSFLGTAFSEFDLVGLAHAYEQKTHTGRFRSPFRKVMPRTQLWNIIHKRTSHSS